MSTPVIQIKDACFGYEKNIVFHHVSLQVYEKDFIGIVGPNGSGKSTLIKMILGILKPACGEINLLGQGVEHFNQWSKVGYISQRVREFNASFPATVEEVVAANLYHQMGFFKLLNKEHKKKIGEVLEIVGMQDYRKRLIGHLSGGQQQRVFIARTLISDPAILFLDEPTVGVDVKSQDVFYALMKKLNKELGLTLLMVSHDIGVVTEHCNRLACMGNKHLHMHDSQNFDADGYITEVYGSHAKKMEHKH